MRPPDSRRHLRAMLLAGGLMGMLAGCESGEFGLSGRNAEWARARGPFSVVSASPRRAVLSAQGSRVAVEPPPGLCLAEESIETSRRSAFVLVGDCVLETASGLPSGSGGMDLPPGMPGMITVSISGDPGLSGPGDLADPEAYLSTPSGRELLSRGGGGAAVSVVDTRRDGETLYVLVEDRAAGALPVLAPRYWRAFVELNGRLAVATISGFRDVPMNEGEMLRRLADQVRQLQMANAVPVDEPPVQVAAAPAGERHRETGSGGEAPVGFGPASPESANFDPPPPPDPAWAALAAPGASAAGTAAPALPGALSDTAPIGLAGRDALSGQGIAVAPPGAVGNPRSGWAALQAPGTAPDPLGAADDPWSGIGGPDPAL